MEDKRLAPVRREAAGGLTDIVKRVGDDVSTLARNHFELARNELSVGLKGAAADLAIVMLGGVVALIGLAMLCVTAVVAAEPVIPALWLRLLLGAGVYMVLGALVIMAFGKRLKHEPATMKHSTEELGRTAQLLKEQVQHG